METSKKSLGAFKELLQFAIIAILIVIPFRIFVAQPFIVNGSSMDPTFENGQYLIVDELTYRFNNPNRGEVIIFRYPKNPEKFFIKRIIGLPGETVEINGGQVIIYNSDHPDGKIFEEPYVVFEKYDDLKVALKEGEYFVMGDNRAESSDSRIWGPLPEENIVGRPFLRLLPIKEIGLLPGNYTK